MSKVEEKKKRSAEEKKKLMVRIIAIILAVLMIGSMAYYTIYILAFSVSAAEPDDTETLDSTDNQSETICTSSLSDSEDVLISVGLMYGDNITTGFECTTTDGYTIGSQYIDGDKDFIPLWDIDEEIVSCTSDLNLYKTGMSFLEAGRGDDVAVGGYHIEVDFGRADREETENLIEDTYRDIDDVGLYIIPAYINGRYRLRIGDFVSWSDAERYLDSVADVYRNCDVYVVEPSETAVSLLEPYSDAILFEYDCEGESELGLKAHEDRNGNTYIETPATNVYDGVFCFRRDITAEHDGVSLTNILPLEAYIAGVLPFETSNNWLLETLKAFAVTVRSFTLTHIEKHAKYGFDLCNTTDCQVYKGAGRINQNVMDAVFGTAGQVMTYEGDIVTAYYSSSMGGVSVSAQDAWGGKDVPYLQAVETPWENYMVHNNAFWINEISPETLCERLNKAGYEKLRDAIEELEIVETAANSTYVKKLRATDIHGNSVVIENTDKVRTSLTPYVKSANFVVGVGEVEYTENVIVDYREPQIDSGNGGSSESYDIDYGYMNLDEYYVITSDSEEKNYIENSVTILTGDGEITHSRKDIFVIAKENAAAFLGDDYLIYIPTDDDEDDYEHNTEIIDDKSSDEVVYKIAYANNKNNFIFVGKGWGHGVGMSQYGALDMAAAGYSAEEILEAYFKDIRIIDYSRSNDFN